MTELLMFKAKGSALPVRHQHIILHVHLPDASCRCSAETCNMGAEL